MTTQLDDEDMSADGGIPRKPLLSVVLPNFNDAEYLNRSLSALAAQSYRPLEVIIVDDASTDNSVAIIDGFVAMHSHFRVIQNKENLGCLRSCRRGHCEARGAYLYTAAADDHVLPDFFNQAMAMAMTYPDAAILCGKMVVEDISGVRLQVNAVEKWQEPCYANPEKALREFFDMEDALHSLTSSTIYKRKCWEEIGGFQECLGFYADTFMIHALSLQYGMCYIPEECSVFTIRPGGLSQSALNQPKALFDTGAGVTILMENDVFRAILPAAYHRSWRERYRERIIRHLSQRLKAQFRSIQRTYFNDIAENTVLTKCMRLGILAMRSLVFRLMPHVYRHLISQMKTCFVRTIFREEMPDFTRTAGPGAQEFEIEAL